MQLCAVTTVYRDSHPQVPRQPAHWCSLCLILAARQGPPCFSRIHNGLQSFDHYAYNRPGYTWIPGRAVSRGITPRLAAVPCVAACAQHCKDMHAAALVQTSSHSGTKHGALVTNRHLMSHKGRSRCPDSGCPEGADTTKSIILPTSTLSQKDSALCQQETISPLCAGKCCRPHMGIHVHTHVL